MDSLCLCQKKPNKKNDFHHLQEVINQGMPVVLFDRVSNDIMCDKVIIDDQLAAYEATNFLISKGLKRIALLTTVDYVSVGKLRTDGYLNVLHDHGIDVDENLIVRIEDAEHCDEKISVLLENKSIDAILAVNELFAVTALKLAMSKGIKIPEDLSVVAFTDGIISKYSTPTITTISQNGIKMGRKAAQMLIDRLELEDEDDEHYKTEIIETNLIIRESTKS